MISTTLIFFFLAFMNFAYGEKKSSFSFESKIVDQACLTKEYRTAKLTELKSKIQQAQKDNQTELFLQLQKEQFKLTMCNTFYDRQLFMSLGLMIYYLNTSNKKSIAQIVENIRLLYLASEECGDRDYAQKILTDFALPLLEGHKILRECSIAKELEATEQFTFCVSILPEQIKLAPENQELISLRDIFECQN